MPEPVSEDGRLEALRLRWERDPGSRIFLQLAEEYRRHGKISDAVRTLEKGLATQPGYLSARVALGRCRLELGDAPGACAVLETVLAADPTQLVANKLLIEAYVRTARPDKARDRLDLYVLLNESDPEIDDLERRVLALEETPQPQDAPPAGRRSEGVAPTPAALPVVAGIENQAQAAVGSPAAGRERRSALAGPLSLPTPVLGSLDLAMVALPPGARRATPRGASGLSRPFPQLARPSDRIRLVRSLAAEGIFRQAIASANAASFAADVDAASAPPPAADWAAPAEPWSDSAEPVVEPLDRPFWTPPAVAPALAEPAAAPAPEELGTASDEGPADAAQPPSLAPLQTDFALAAEPAATSVETPIVSAGASPSPWWKIPPSPAEPAATVVEAEPAVVPESPVEPAEVVADAMLTAVELEAPAPPVEFPMDEPEERVAEPLPSVDPVPPTPRSGRSISSADATATLAELYLQQGHIDEAEKSFRSVLARDPGNLQAAAGLDEVGRRRRQIGARSAGQAVPLGLTARKIRALQGYLERIREGARRHVS